MTIYKTRPAEKKDFKDGPGPEVYPDLLPNEKKKDEEEVALHPPTVVTVTTRSRRYGGANLCVLGTALLVLATGIFGGIYLYKHLAHRTFQGWCDIKYYELDHQNNGVSDHQRSDRIGRHMKHKGQFEEYIEIDKVEGKYEKIDVPQFEDCEKATVLHDFERNMTAIVDRDHFRCFLMPLNRTIIKPPKDFWDMLSKLSTGYYMPDVEMIRERYAVIHPPVRSLSMYGYYIWRECHRFSTYKMKHIGPHDPIAMVKRDTSAAESYNHLKFAIAGSDQVLPVIEIEGL